MTSLDSLKNPVALRFPARESRAPQERSAATLDQRQAVTQGGKSLPANAAAEPEKVDLEAQVREIREASKTIASFVQNVSRELRFSVDADLGRTVVTVVDQTTDQVIRQIPGEEAIAMAKYISEQSLAGVQGLLVTEKA